MSMTKQDIDSFINVSINKLPSIVFKWSRREYVKLLKSEVDDLRKYSYNLMSHIS